jgi:hypothetical protein
VWPALAAAALVEQHDPVARRVEQPPHVRGQAAAGSAVQEHRRLAVRVAALLPVDLLTVTDLEQADA